MSVNKYMKAILLPGEYQSRLSRWTFQMEFSKNDKSKSKVPVLTVVFDVLHEGNSLEIPRRLYHSAHPSSAFFQFLGSLGEGIPDFDDLKKLMSLVERLENVRFLVQCEPSKCGRYNNVIAAYRCTS